MRCDVCQSCIEDRLAGRVTEPLAADFDAHVRDCTSCARELAAVKAITEALSSLRDEAPPAELMTSLRVKLEAAAADMAGAGARPRPSIAGWLRELLTANASLWRGALASAASVAVCLLVLSHFEVSFRREAPGPTAGPVAVSREPQNGNANANADSVAEGREVFEATVALNRDVLVELEVDVPRDLDEAEFRVAIDSGLVFASDDPEIVSRHELVWNDTLKKGVHRIPIVVRGVAAGRFELNALITDDEDDILTVRNITFDVRSDPKAGVLPAGAAGVPDEG